MCENAAFLSFTKTKNFCKLSKLPKHQRAQGISHRKALLIRLQSIPDKMEFHFWCLCMKIVDIFPFSLSIFDVSVNYLPKTVSLSNFSFHFQEICAKNSIFFHFIEFPFYREWTVVAEYDKEMKELEEGTSTLPEFFSDPHSEAGVDSALSYFETPLVVSSRLTSLWTQEDWYRLTYSFFPFSNLVI